MTKQLNSPGDNIRYRSPQIKVVSVKSRHVLCGSPVSQWQNGSDTEGGDMNEDGGW